MEDLLDDLSAPTRLGTKPGLERVRALLAELGNPERDLTVVHVGGTSGKGSTATVLAAILGEAGLRVGLHAKPHLQSVAERFVVDGNPIAEDRLADRLREVEPIARECAPSWHELTTALMLDHFRREAVDVAIVEVGLGGTYDSTNVVTPAICVLTNVGLDHTEVLGDTVEEIARDKVGIIKAGARVVTGVRQQSVREIVRSKCESVGVPLWRLGEDIAYRIADADSTGSTFDLTVSGREYPGLHLALVGRHQVENAALAVAAALALAARGIEVSESAIRRALATVRVPGRIEEIRRSPRVILDGAHNPDKMRALAAALREDFRWRRLIGVLAFKRGHDHQSTLAEIAPLLDSCYLTRFAAATDFGRDAAQDLDPLLDCWRRTGATGRVMAHLSALGALRDALAEAGPEDIVVVTGSLYLVGQARGWLIGGEA